MLSLCLGQTENGLAVGAFAIYVGFSITEFVLAKPEKTAEGFVFFSSCRNIAREHSEDYPEAKRSGG